MELAASATRSAAAQTRSLKTAVSAAAAKQPSTEKSASSPGKSGSAAHADESGAQSNSAASAGKSAAAGKSGAGKSAKASSSANSSNGGGQKDGSAAAADAGAAGNSADNNPGASGVSKGRGPARGAAAKANASGAADPLTAANANADPSADVSNASGLSLLQLLAQSLGGDHSAASSTDTTTTASTDKAADGGGSDTANNDANALALAMFAQAFAGALGTSPATAQDATSNSSPTTSDSATGGVTSAAPFSGGSVQDLVSVLTQNIATDANGKSDAARSDSATSMSSPGDASTATTSGAAATAANNPLALAHLGAASHFSLQQTQADTNTGELKSSIGTAAWTDELGGRLTWMTHRGLESGSLRVSPEHLGPVEVKISVQNGDASVWFGASHPDTRAALEQALPRLREMFATQGMTLTDSGVSRESPRQTRSSSPQSVGAVSAVSTSDVSVSAAVRLSLGLVDTYA